ncbi:MAG: hypothetical protein IIZ07_04000 [Ruminococcus sp.]|nr:hypothetical protein [Ruminococcus sp.]
MDNKADTTFQFEAQNQEAPVNIADKIRLLKKIKEDHGLSFQAIQTVMDACGYHVAMNTIRRIFADGSEHDTFRYKDTVQPVARVLFGIFASETMGAEIDALRAAIIEKDAVIAKKDEELKKEKEDAKIRIEYLKKQIEGKDSRIDTLLALLTQKTGILTRNED